MRAGARHRRGLSLIELLVVLAIAAIFVALASVAFSHSMREASRADALARLRMFGQAVHLYAADHEQTYPGPLWPGQVMQYDPEREGRLVRELADYLGVERRDQPYVLDRMIPRAVLSAMPGANPADIRVYVVNTDVFGSSTVTNSLPAKVAARPESSPVPWMISEADQLQSVVAVSPWKANTPAQPVHKPFRALIRTDGSALLDRVPDS